mmetsp:Transcript_2917/g.7817  ORF Transcript_2917/g.7817 Transcript_2917/m.7817 type:complete len:215 (-) Transcript_2917:1668-2312(-)
MPSISVACSASSAADAPSSSTYRTVPDAPSTDIAKSTSGPWEANTCRSAYEGSGSASLKNSVLVLVIAVVTAVVSTGDSSSHSLGLESVLTPASFLSLGPSVSSGASSSSPSSASCCSLFSSAFSSVSSRGSSSATTPRVTFPSAIAASVASSSALVRRLVVVELTRRGLDAASGPSSVSTSSVSTSVPSSDSPPFSRSADGEFSLEYLRGPGS